MCGGRVAAYVWDTIDKSWLETLVTSILLYFFLPPPSATNANMEDFIFLATDLHPRKVTFSLTYYILKNSFSCIHRINSSGLCLLTAGLRRMPISLHLESHLHLLLHAKVVASAMCLRDVFGRTDEEFLKAVLGQDVHF